MRRTPEEGLRTCSFESTLYFEIYNEIQRQKERILYDRLMDEGIDATKFIKDEQQSKFKRIARIEVIGTWNDRTEEIWLANDTPDGKLILVFLPFTMHFEGNDTINVTVHYKVFGLPSVPQDDLPF